MRLLLKEQSELGLHCLLKLCCPCIWMVTIIHNLFCSRPNITALGEVLEEIEELNRRLQPHLQRFTQIVRDDAETGENVSMSMCYESCRGWGVWGGGGHFKGGRRG